MLTATTSSPHLLQVAFRGVFAALSTPSPLHTAIESGDYETAAMLVRAHPMWVRWKHRGMLPLHAAVARVANCTLEEETGELLPLTEPVRRQRHLLVETLIKSSPDTVHTRVDSNWSLGVANGLTALQIAVTPPSDCAGGAKGPPPPPLDLGVVAALIEAGGPAALLSSAPRVDGDVPPQGFCAKRVLEAELGLLASGAGASYAAEAMWIPAIARALALAAEVEGAGETLCESVDVVGEGLEAIALHHGGDGDTLDVGSDAVATPAVPSVDVHPAHGADLTCDELKARLSERALCELVSQRFFEEFAPDEQRLLFRLAALTRSFDCINTPSRFTAELDVAERGESALETFLSGLRVRCVQASARV
jgi:hypothetical protein